MPKHIILCSLLSLNLLPINFQFRVYITFSRKLSSKFERCIFLVSVNPLLSFSLTKISMRYNIVLCYKDSTVYYFSVKANAVNKIFMLLLTETIVHKIYLTVLYYLA